MLVPTTEPVSTDAVVINASIFVVVGLILSVGVGKSLVIVTICGGTVIEVVALRIGL